MYRQSLYWWHHNLLYQQRPNGSNQHTQCWPKLYCYECNRLKTNINKTQLRTLERKTSKNKCDQIWFYVRGANIAKSEQINYLGVIVDCNRSWKPQIAKIRKKDFAALATMRASRFLQSKTCKTMFSLIVLPHLDYCSTVWHLSNSVFSQSIERIQKYAMWIILKQPHRYCEREAQLNYSSKTHNFTLCLVQRCVAELIKLHPIWWTSSKRIQLPTVLIYLWSQQT